MIGRGSFRLRQAGGDAVGRLGRADARRVFLKVPLIRGSAVNRRGFLIQGFRNPDLRRRLWPQAQSDPALRRQASGRVTRLLRLLRAHGLIRKVSATRYLPSYAKRILRHDHRVATQGSRPGRSSGIEVCQKNKLSRTCNTEKRGR